MPTTPTTPPTPADRARAAESIALLRQEYPDAACALHFATPFELLVATILSAQCTDERVNAVTAVVFPKYPTVAAFAEADPEALEQEFKQINFYRNKAKNIREAARLILERFGGEVPRTIEEIASLPGAGRKTANVVLSNAYGIVDGVITDTHVLRLSRRLGFTASEDPLQVERDLMALLPQDEWLHVAHLMAFHGRASCNARAPQCESCAVLALCPTGSERLGAVVTPASAASRTRRSRA